MLTAVSEATRTASRIWGLLPIMSLNWNAVKCPLKRLTRLFTCLMGRMMMTPPPGFPCSSVMGSPEIKQWLVPFMCGTIISTSQ